MFHSLIFLMLVVCGALRRIAAGSVIPHTEYTRAMTVKSALRTEQAKEEKWISTATENII